MGRLKTAWVDDTTPDINAANLNSIENGIDLNSEYITATAGSNGDFHVDIDAYYELTTNSILKVAFPTATNGASNARLSIDGGTTYKNIFDHNAQILASVVSGRNLEIYYDGTQWRYKRLTRFVPITPVEILNTDPADTNYTDLNVSAYVSTKAVSVMIGIFALAGATVRFVRVRKNGTSLTGNVVVGGATGQSAYGFATTTVDLDANKIFEWSVNNADVSSVIITLQGYFEYVD